MASEASELNRGIPKELNGRFTVGAVIAERPSCIVCRGVDKELGNRAVAIKFFVDRPTGRQDLVEAFEREVAVLRAASHPSLVPIISGGYEGGWLYIVMELLEGKTLRDYLKDKNGPVDPTVSVELIVQLCAGLKEIHEKNGFHGHIDSRAILFKGDDVRLAGYYPHVVNEIQKAVTSSGRLIVDPAYVSPDQISGSGDLDGRSDIYTLSVLLYELLTGRKPYVADSPMQLAMMRLSKDPDSPRKLNPAISPLVDAAVMKGLSRERNQRFANVAEFVDALTGGKKPIKNPLLAAMGEDGERLGGTETIAVSMSTEAIKHILHAHEAKKAEKAATSAVDSSVTSTATRAPAGDPISTASTQIGMKAENPLRASFIVLNGDERGNKYIIDRTQVMIGSDPGCDMTITGKGIPPRYAIVVQRDGQFFVGPLSGSPVSVNGKEVQGANEVQLKRGDVLNVGANQLRFVAPGEVFTLRDSVADRVIDRPPNRLPKILGALAVILVIVCGAFFYMYRQSVENKQRQIRIAQENKKKQQRDLIDRLRGEGDELFKNGALVQPAEANARKRFEQILDIDPEDTYAKRRLSEIDDRIKTLNEQEERRRQFSERITKLLTDGQRLFQAGSYIAPPGANAREAYQEILRLDPQNETAQKQLAEINRILNDLLGQVNGFIEKAKTYIDARQYVSPPGENAKEMVDRIVAVDPSSKDAHTLLIDMAARSLMDGDRAKAELKPDEMRQSYLNAQALGVEPEFINKKLQGIDTIKRSKGSVVIIDTSQASGGDKKDGGKYLSMSEIEQRINVLQAQGYGQSGEQGKRFYEINKGKVK
ncbi:MAG: protein kinase [Bdellovibrionota bacterium]